MSNRLNLSVTRSNLLKLREELEFAQEGYELLEQKREVLVMEVMAMLEDLRRCRREVERDLQAAYSSLEEASVVLGEKTLNRATAAAVLGEEIRLRDRSIMGVVIPIVDYTQDDKICQRYRYGFQGTSASLDQTVQCFCISLEKLAKLAQLEVSLLRLATELKKTQRRANALNYLFIPQYRETINYLENTLEEKERQELFQLKRAKDYHEE